MAKYFHRCGKECYDGADFSSGRWRNDYPFARCRPGCLMSDVSPRVPPLPPTEEVEPAPHLDSRADLQDEQRARWQRGERVLVEQLLSQHPTVKVDAEGLLELVYNEVLLREQRGECPRHEEYVDRFPQLSG